MSIYEILERLANTLEVIEVHGNNNLSHMLGAMQAVEQLKIIIAQMPPKDGDENGRQTDQ